MKGLQNIAYKMLACIVATACAVSGLGIAVSADNTGLSAVYTRTAETRGFGGGTVTITPGGENAEAYELYWGGASGKLADYTPIGSVAANGTNPVTFEINKDVMIPQEASRIYVYPKNGDSAVGDAAFADIDESALLEKTDKKFSFQVISDLHSGNWKDFYKNQNIRAALSDIKATDPTSKGVFTNGDNVEANKDECWDVLVSDIADTIGDSIPVYYTIGNHELKVDESGTYDEQVARYFRYTNAPSDHIYYMQKIEGQYFIHLGSQSQREDGYADLQQDQIDWLKQTLDQAEAEDARAYVFLHQPLKNTVSGSLENMNQVWYGVVQDSEVRKIFDAYPNAMVFSGHGHWNLEAVQPALLGGGIKASYFNAGAVGELWGDEEKVIQGSQGLYVEVYEDKIIVRGRDFINKKWISAAQFVVYTENEYVYNSAKNFSTASKDGKWGGVWSAMMHDIDGTYVPLTTPFSEVDEKHAGGGALEKIKLTDGYISGDNSLTDDNDKNYPMYFPIISGDTLYDPKWELYDSSVDASLKHNRFPVRVFTAPYTGKILIAQASGKNGAVEKTMIISKKAANGSDKEIWRATIPAWGEYVQPERTVQVKAGDKIYFETQRTTMSGGNSAQCPWTNVIRYTHLGEPDPTDVIYDSSENFSTASGDGVWDGVWSAMMHDIDGSYKSLTVSDKGGYTGGTSDVSSGSLDFPNYFPMVNGETLYGPVQSIPDWIEGVSDKGHNRFPVRVFTAPYDGKLSIAEVSQVGNANVDVTMVITKKAADGSSMEIWKGTATAWNTCTQPKQDVKVKAGDKIYFEEQRITTSEWNRAACQWTNVIQYTYVGEPDPMKETYVSSEDFDASSADGTWNDVWAAYIYDGADYSYKPAAVVGEYDGEKGYGLDSDSNSARVSGEKLNMQGVAGIKNSPARTFIAPTNGNIKIEKTDINFAADNNAILTVVKEDVDGLLDVVWRTKIWWGTRETSQPELSVWVKKGDKIHFEVRKQDPTQDLTWSDLRVQWINTLKYTEIGEKPVESKDPVIEFLDGNGNPLTTFEKLVSANDAKLYIPQKYFNSTEEAVAIVSICDENGICQKYFVENITDLTKDAEVSLNGIGGIRGSAKAFVWNSFDKMNPLAEPGEIKYVDTVKLGKDVKTIAHKGLSGIETENTVAAFEAAAKRGYYGIETDVQITRDGEFVCFHDDTTGSLAERNLVVTETELEELRGLKLNQSGDTIATLDEYLDVLKKYEKTAIIEIKAEPNRAQLEKLVAEVSAKGYLDKTIFISYSKNALVILRELLPNQKLQYVSNTYSEELIAELKQYNFGVAILNTELTKERVDKLHSEGIEIQAWTVDDPNKAKELADMGVDYISSNIIE